MADHHVPGVALGLLEGDQLHLRGFGVTRLDDPQPVTEDTLFTIASISKTMTATAVMKLVEEGRLDLQSPVRTWLPDFRVRDDVVSQTVTPWHLLTHTPGWEGQLGTEDRGVDALSQFVSTIMPTLPKLADPGEVWSYNNAGFALTGRIIEVVTGRSIHDALKDLRLHAARAVADVHTVDRRHDVADVARPQGSRRPNGSHSPVPDDVEYDRRRRDDLAV